MKSSSTSECSIKVFTISALVLGTTLGVTRASNASTPQISCNMQNAIPEVVASFTSENNSIEAVMLRFLPEYFSFGDGQKQCQTTANSLQELYHTDEMQYLASDTINERPVVCAVTRRGSGCDSHKSQLLFTVERQVNPTQVLYDMLGKDFKESELPVPRTVSRIYTDLRPRWWPFQR